MIFKEKNSGLYQSLLLVIFIFITIGGYSFLYNKSTFLKEHFKDVPAIQQTKTPSSFNNKRLAKQKIINTVKYQIQQKDALLFQAQIDSINTFNNYSGDNYLHFFLEALKNKDNSTVRIAYIGDSSIEGDLMSMSLRKFFQNKYGGSGVGFVPISSKTAGFRTTIKHRFSNNWEYASIVVGNSSQFKYGFSGEVFYHKTDTAKQDSTINLWVEYAHSGGLGLSKLYYGRNDSVDKADNILKVADKKYNLQENKFLNELVLNEQTPNKITLEFEMNHSIPVYGVSFESRNGVIVDNYSSRSNSGMPLTSISNQMLIEYQAYMKYDLVILQFGLNALGNSANQEYSWYKTAMKRVLSKYKAAMPGTSFLLVSIGDKSDKDENGFMQTNPNVIKMVETQKEIARESEVAFFNLFEAMGGKNSMVTWVDELAWANKDYTHFNFKGSEVAADSLFQFMMKAKKKNEE